MTRVLFTPQQHIISGSFYPQRPLSEICWDTSPASKPWRRETIENRQVWQAIKSSGLKAQHSGGTPHAQSRLDRGRRPDPEREEGDTGDTDAAEDEEEEEVEEEEVVEEEEEEEEEVVEEEVEAEAEAAREAVGGLEVGGAPVPAVDPSSSSSSASASTSTSTLSGQRKSQSGPSLFRRIGRNSHASGDTASRDTASRRFGRNSHASGDTASRDTARKDTASRDTASSGGSGGVEGWPTSANTPSRDTASTTSPWDSPWDAAQVETQPAETQPAETQPAETQPADPWQAVEDSASGLR